MLGRIVLIGFLLGLGTAFWGTAGAVTYAESSCIVYKTREKSPDAVNEILASGEFAAVRVCEISANKETFYYVISSPKRSSFGVCEYNERRIFYAGGKRWSVTPPEDMPFLGRSDQYKLAYSFEGNCPEADSKKYIQTVNLDDRTFLRMLDLIKEFLRGNQAGLQVHFLDDNPSDHAKTSRIFRDATDNSAIILKMQNFDGRIAAYLSLDSENFIFRFPNWTIIEIESSSIK